MTGTAIPNARTTRWAVSRSSTRARRSRPPTSGGATDEDGRASIAGRCPEPTGSEHRRERQRPRSGTTAEATHVVDRGAERDRSRGEGTVSTTYDPYAGSRETTEGRVYTVTGGDWDQAFGADPHEAERLVVNMGPQHPSTHGVLRLVLDLEGGPAPQARAAIGYLHTGIEKTTEYRTWTQGTTLVTRMDYLAPLFNETAYCMAVEKLLGVEAPPRAQTIRVLVMELNRIASHLVGLATFGMEMGALTGMTNGFRERELVRDLLEEITGLRMNHAYVRPGGLAQDLPEGAEEHIREFLAVMPERITAMHRLLTGQPIWQRRLKDVGFLDVTGCLALGVTGPILRSAGLPWDLRKVEPYCGYETYDFEVPTADTAD